MDILWVVLAGIAILVGIVGSFLPVLPGPPIAWVGLLMLHYSKYASFRTSFLVTTALITIALVALDYWIPAWGTKKFGGSKWGQWGATLGIVIGLFFGPFGIILGPFLGAFIGELLHSFDDVNKAFRSALGSFMGFLLGTGLKLGLCLVFAFYYVKELIK